MDNIGYAHKENDFLLFFVFQPNSSFLLLGFSFLVQGEGGRRLFASSWFSPIRTKKNRLLKLCLTRFTTVDSHEGEIEFSAHGY